jgi:DNA-binding response OmpR family regulator
MSEKGSPSPRLLVVDDDSELRLFLQDLLNEEGYRVDIGATMDEALALIDSHVYHLIITDLLAHSSTDPLRSAVQLNERAHPTPVAALTGWNVSPSEVARAGLARLIPKPFDINDLLASIAECLATPLNTEQQRQAEVVGRYCEAINANDVDACLATCADDVRVYPSERSLWSSADPKLGRAAFRAHLEGGILSTPDMRFDDYLIHPQPSGIALRCVKSWASPAIPTGRATVAGSLYFQFAGERISQITVRCHSESLEPLPLEAIYLPSAHHHQS